MKIVVVVFGYGIEFFVEGVKDVQGCIFDVLVVVLVSMGVEFCVCYNLLMVFKVLEDKLLFEVKVVLVGVVEIICLQQEEGFVYIKLQVIYGGDCEI